MEFAYRFLQDQRGATAIEYAAIAAFLSVVIGAVVAGIGSTVKAKFMGVQFPGT